MSKKVLQVRLLLCCTDAAWLTVCSPLVETATVHSIADIERSVFAWRPTHVLIEATAQTAEQCVDTFWWNDASLQVAVVGLGDFHRGTAKVSKIRTPWELWRWLGISKR